MRPSGSRPALDSRDDVNVLFDFDLTRTFTSAMRTADASGHLQDVTFLADIPNGARVPDRSEKTTILRITGTPMQVLWSRI